MFPIKDDHDRPGARAAAFRTTHWSVVLKAAQRGSPGGEEALAKLCQTYWDPLYVFIRRRGYSPEEAEDLTQGFFAQLLEKNLLAGLKVEGGKFRSYLLTLLKHFLANERERELARKRGGGATRVPIDRASAEARYHAELVEATTPESLFERHWALALLDQVMDQLRSQYVAARKTEFFEQLRPFLSGAERMIPYAEISASLGLSEGAVKVAVHRLRKQYGQLLRAEIAATVGSASEVEAEIRHLIAVTSG
jgi:RNA polymerase sigma-70 factor (ECF subfamily)